MNFRLAAVVLLTLSLVGCGSGGDPVGESVGTMKDRKLGFGVTEGQIGFEASFAAARNAGLQFVELPQQWDEVETAKGNFASEFAATANQVYPPTGTAIVLSLNPIDTSSSRVPKHLERFAWDSPERIESFNRWFDWTMKQLASADVLAVSIGNEVDAWLAEHPEEIAGYGAFFKATREHIRKAHPKVAVGCKMTFSGRRGPLGQSLSQIDETADALMLTYYPLDENFQVRPVSEVSGDFTAIVQLAGDRPIHLLEAGYPSGSACGSSLEQQAQFIDALFSAWDEHLAQVKFVNLVWTCDLPQPQVDELTKYYRVKLPAFREYLATLGLRTSSGKNKPAFARVRQNIAKRAK